MYNLDITRSVEKVLYVSNFKRNEQASLLAIGEELLNT